MPHYPFDFTHQINVGFVIIVLTSCVYTIAHFESFDPDDVLAQTSCLQTFANNNERSHDVIVNVKKNTFIEKIYFATLLQKPLGHHWKLHNINPKKVNCPDIIYTLHLGNETMQNDLDFYAKDEDIRKFGTRVNEKSHLFLTNDERPVDEGLCLKVKAKSKSLVSHKEGGVTRHMNVFQNNSQGCFKKKHKEHVLGLQTAIEFYPCGDAQFEGSEFSCSCNYNFEMLYNCAPFIERICSSKVSTLSKSIVSGVALKTLFSWVISDASSTNIWIATAAAFTTLKSIFEMENWMTDNTFLISQDESAVSAYVLNTRERFSNVYYEILTYYVIVILGLWHSIKRCDQKYFVDKILIDKTPTAELLKDWSVQNIMFNNPGVSICHWNYVYPYIDLLTWILTMILMYIFKWFLTLRMAWHIFYIKSAVDAYFYVVVWLFIFFGGIYLIWQFFVQIVLAVYRARTKNASQVVTYQLKLDFDTLYYFNVWSLCCFKIVTHIAQWLFIITLMENTSKILSVSSAVDYIDQWLFIPTLVENTSNYLGFSHLAHLYDIFHLLIGLSVAFAFAFLHARQYCESIYVDHNAYSDMCGFKLIFCGLVSWSVPVMRLFGWFTYNSPERLWMSSFFHEGFMIHNGHITVYVQIVVLSVVILLEALAVQEKDKRLPKRGQKST